MSMSLYLRTPIVRVAAGAFLFSAAGCVVAHSDTMAKVETPAALKAPADQAVVVFVRHTKYGGAVLFTILDENGKFLGVSQGNSHFASTLPPGHHVFITGAANNTSAIDATLAAGKIYFVEVSVRPGAWVAAPEMYAVKPGSDEWKDHEGWLKDTDEFVPDLAKGQHDLGETKDRIKDGLDAYKGYDDKEKNHRTLVEADGV
jgi:hypothetical protein